MILSIWLNQRQPWWQSHRDSDTVSQRLIIIIIIIFIIYKAQYPNMFKALYNKIQNYLLCVKTYINYNKYNWKINFQIKNVETLNYIKTVN